MWLACLQLHKNVDSRSSLHEYSINKHGMANIGDRSVFQKNMHSLRISQSVVSKPQVSKMQYEIKLHADCHCPAAYRI